MVEERGRQTEPALEEGSIRRRGLLLALGFCTAGADASRTGSAAKAPPNVEVIMGDDLGYSDLGAYGGEVRTPSLDALAAGGVRFSQFVVCQGDSYILPGNRKGTQASIYLDSVQVGATREINAFERKSPA